MRLKTLGIVTFFTVLAAGLAGTASAEDLHVTADIAFAFQAAGKTLPPGHYEFTEVGANGGEIHIAGKGTQAIVPVLTQLSSEIHGHANDAHIVFDVVNNVHTLSEVWQSGVDGVLVHATKGPHTHKVVTTPK
jgi:methenyltetrahydromethanopterin cyclohydrolase